MMGDVGTTRFDIPTINSAKSLKTLVGLLVKCRCSMLLDDIDTAKRDGRTRLYGYNSLDECYEAIQVYEGELRRYVYKAIDRLCGNSAVIHTGRRVQVTSKSAERGEV